MDGSPVAAAAPLVVVQAAADEARQEERDAAQAGQPQAEGVDVPAVHITGLHRRRAAHTALHTRLSGLNCTRAHTYFRGGIARAALQRRRISTTSTTAENEPAG